MFRDKTLSAVPRLEKVPSGIYYLTWLLGNIFLIEFHLEETFSYGIHEVRDSSAVFVLQVTVAWLVEFVFLP